MNKNYWIAYENEAFIRWDFTLPIANANDLLNISQKIIDNTEYINFFSDNGSTNYYEELHSYFINKDIGFFLDVSHINVLRNSNFWNQGVKIKYFNKEGELSEGIIDDCHTFLREINSLSEDDYRYAGSTPPIQIKSQLLSLKQPGILKFSIIVRTNIFFTEIDKYYSLGTLDKPMKYIDNQILARENIKLFNLWFRQIRDLIIERNGIITLGESLGSQKYEVATEEGFITL